MVVAFTTSTFDHVLIHREGMQLGWGGEFLETYTTVLTQQGGFTGEVTGWLMTKNSFDPRRRLRGRQDRDLDAGRLCHRLFPLPASPRFAFWIIFLTLLLPLEVRILPSYEVVQQLGLLNTYTGLILPLIASATGTFFFRQFFKSCRTSFSKRRGSMAQTPVAVLVDILVPLSKTMMAAIFIIMFVVGWNQYLWPTLMTTDETYFTLVRGIKQVMQNMIGADIPEI